MPLSGQGIGGESSKRLGPKLPRKSLGVRKHEDSGEKLDAGIHFEGHARGKALRPCLSRLPRLRKPRLRAAQQVRAGLGREGPALSAEVLSTAEGLQGLFLPAKAPEGQALDQYPARLPGLEGEDSLGVPEGLLVFPVEIGKSRPLEEKPGLRGAGQDEVQGGHGPGPLPLGREGGRELQEPLRPGLPGKLRGPFLSRAEAGKDLEEPGIEVPHGGIKLALLLVLLEALHELPQGGIPVFALLPELGLRRSLPLLQGDHAQHHSAHHVLLEALEGFPVAVPGPRDHGPQGDLLPVEVRDHVQYPVGEFMPGRGLQPRVEDGPARDRPLRAHYACDLMGAVLAHEHAVDLLSAPVEGSKEYAVAPREGKAGIALQAPRVIRSLDSRAHGSHRGLEAPGVPGVELGEADLAGKGPEPRKPLLQGLLSAGPLDEHLRDGEAGLKLWRRGEPHQDAGAPQEVESPGIHFGASQDPAAASKGREGALRLARALKVQDKLREDP